MSPSACSAVAYFLTCIDTDDLSLFEFDYILTMMNFIKDAQDRNYARTAALDENRRASTNAERHTLRCTRRFVDHCQDARL